MGMAMKSFEGISTNIPGVYSKSIFPPSAGNTGARTNVVAIIGSCDAGVPYNAAGVDDASRLNVISSVAQALDVLRGGDAYYMAEFFLTPTKDAALNKPSEVIVFRVDPAEQAVSTVKDGSSNTIIALKSSRYGTVGNQLCRKIVTGTSEGYRVTLKFQGSIVADVDNITLNCLQIQYTGSGTAATMTINSTGLTTSVTGASADNLSLTWADFPTLGALAAFIDEHPAYTCTLMTASNESSDILDAVSSQDIMTTAYTAKALVEALIRFFNKQSGGEVVASLETGAARTPVAVDTNFVFFTGGTKGTATATDWANCLAYMEKFKLNHILVASGNPTYAAMVDDHCQRMSGIKEKRNRAASGGAALGKDLATRIAESRAMNSARFEYHYTPIYRADVVNNGEVKQFAPFFGAALTAGIRYANNVTMSATFKSVNVLGVAEKYDTPTKEKIISAGGTLFGVEENGVVVIHNVTTYQGQNLILNLPSMLRTCDAITLDSQARIQARLAAQMTAADALIINDMKNFLTTNLLPDYRDSKKWLTDDPINGDKAFSDVEFRLEGDAFYFTFTGIVPAPMHFVFVKQKFVVPGSK